jgi:hypothetical protein
MKLGDILTPSKGGLVSFSTIATHLSIPIEKVAIVLNDNGYKIKSVRSKSGENYKYAKNARCFRESSIVM